MTTILENHAEQRTADPSKLPGGFATVPAPYGKDAVDADGNKMSHVFGAGVEQGAAPLHDETLGENLRAIMEKFPSRDAVVDVYADVSFTFERFYDRALRLASAFIRADYRPGDRIGIWSTNRWEWTVMQYACHHTGLVLVNIDPTYRQHELNYMLEKAGVRMVFVTRRYKDSDYRIMLIEVSKQRGVHLDKVIYLGSSEWYEHMHSRIGDLNEYTSQLKPDGLINIQFASGTTDFPKGATLTHRNLLNNRYFISELLGHTETDRTCVPAPFFHIFGVVIGTFATFTHGAAIVVPVPSFKARETLKAAHLAKTTSLYGVSTMLINELEEAHDQEEYSSPYDLSIFRTGVMVDTSYPSKTMCDVMDKLNIHEVAICYGMTETSPVSFQTRANSPLEKRVNAAGQIVSHLEAHIICEETGRTSPRGEQGEVVARGHSVMKEYWERPEETTEAIGADDWIHTEDLSVLDDEGYLSITGRIKDMLIRGGENIYPREIEEFLFVHPAVVDARVIGVPDDKYDREIVVWVILYDDVEGLTAEDVAAFAHGKLPHHKIPRYAHVVEEFPMTASGKVRRVEMRGMASRILGQV